MQEVSPTWIRKDFEDAAFAQETAAWFRKIFPNEPSSSHGLRVLSRQDSETGQCSLLTRLPSPLGEEHAEWMEGWRPANDDAADLSGWHVEI